MSGIIEDTMTREELPAKNTHMSDELTEAELKYFQSGGQDISSLLGDPGYKDDVESLNAERQAIEEQRTKQPTEPEQTYQEIPAKKPAVEVVEDTQPPKAEAEPVSEEFKFEELQIGQDGRLRDASGKFVPLAALREEREKFKQQRDSNQELLKANEDLREKYAKLSERIATLQEVWSKSPEAKQEVKKEETPKTIAQGLQELLTAENVPTPEEDIFGFANWQKGVIEKQNQAIAALEEMITSSRKEIVEKEIQPVRQQLTEKDVVDYYRQDAANFASTQTDFGDAYRYLMNQRHATLAFAGFTDPEQRQSQIRQEERDLVDLALKQNKRPAEFIYNYAVAAGYRKPVADPNPTPPANPAPANNANLTAQPNPAVQQPLIAAQPNPAERLQNQVNAQNAAATLSGTGGAASETLTAEAIANMSERDFIELSKKLGKAGMRQYLGGV